LAASNLFVRKGVQATGESFSVVIISAFMGFLILLPTITFEGNIERLTSLSWVGISALAAAGIINYIVARSFSYTSIRLIGANRASPIFLTEIFFAAAMGVSILGESLTPALLLALPLVLGGMVLITISGNSEKETGGIPHGLFIKGILTALGAGFSWGILPTLIKIGLREIGSPLLANFVAYAVVTVVFCFLLLRRSNREKLLSLNRAPLVLFIITGILTSLTQIIRYYTLSYIPVTVATPLFATHAFFVLPLSFLFIRRQETFNWKVIIGAIMSVAGVFLIFLDY